MDHEVIFEVKRVDELDNRQRSEIIDLCTIAYDEDFADWFDVLPGSTHVLARLGGKLVSHAAWVTRWLQPQGHAELRTAYVEAVATAPAYQRRGFGKAVMAELRSQIGQYDLGALSPSDPAFYEPLGWELWRGPLAIRSANGLLETPNDRVMVMRLGRSRDIDVNRPMTAEWRHAELW